MGRARRQENTGMASVNRSTGASWRRFMPAWLTETRERKLWTRVHFFHWKQIPGEAPFDNPVPDRLDWIVTALSRLMGPMLMLAGCMAVLWGTIKWLA